MNITGACHCKNIRFTLSWPNANKRPPARACGCSFCQKHGGVWTSHPQASLRATVEDMQIITKYTFGTSTAEFYICCRCGVPTFVVSEIDAHLYAVVNVNAFENFDASRLDRAKADFDGETTSSRLARRVQNWISSVQIKGAEQ